MKRHLFRTLLGAAYSTLSISCRHLIVHLSAGWIQEKQFVNEYPEAAPP